MPLRLGIAIALTLIPVTILVPGINELVGIRYGATDAQVHAFMSINMIAGVIAVPLAMRWLSRHPHVRWWLFGALVVDAVAFLGMGQAPSLYALFAWRALEGAVHLVSITFLMIAANRAGEESRGKTMGGVASAVMIGVALGSPLGGALASRGAWAVYGTGAALLIVAAALSTSLPPVHYSPKRASRYRWRWTNQRAWIPLFYGFMDRFSIGVFVSTFTLYMAREISLTAPQRGAMIALFMVPFAMLSYPVGRLAERHGWFRPLVCGNAAFGIVFALYGFTTASTMPIVMLASGVSAALIFAPNLLLTSQLVDEGEGEGLFGALQVAGSLGFLVGPMVGGLAMAWSRAATGAPAYRAIFASVGALELALAALSYVALRSLATRRTVSQSMSLNARLARRSA